MLKKLLSQIGFFCTLLSLSGCVRSPFCFLLPTPTAARYPRAECVQNGSNIRQLGWQTFFSDPKLQQLICLALKNNRELRAARIQSERCAICVRLIGQVANTYLIAGELNELICLTMKTIKVREESCCIVKRRFEEGTDAEFDFLLAESLLQQAQTALVDFQRRRELNWNALTLLVGCPIDCVDSLLSQMDLCFTQEICPGLPSELVCNRSDVRAAALCIMGCCKNQNLALIEYERTYQTAFREVADALAGCAFLSKQILLQQELLEAQTERARLAWIRFQCSTTPFFEVLDAERDKFAAELAFVQTLRSLLSSRVNLYTALGGS